MRQLENSKKEMTNILKDTVRDIADKVKSIEERMNQTYLSVRKAILAQVTIEFMA